jgi:adenine-specific DNA-methyltransferase
LHPNKLTNIWVPFLVISASRLNRFGKLAMVIPAELFQVKYAAETRVFLSEYFSRITIVTFKKLVFKDIQQEIVLLLCEKDVTTNKGIRVLELNNLSELASIEIDKVHKAQVKSLEHSTEKWIKYFLEENEILLLRRIKSGNKIKLCSDIMDVDVGIVTGLNEFFMLSKESVDKWKLKSHTTKVVSKSNQMKGIVYTDSDFENNSKEDCPVHLFLPANQDFSSLPKVCREYIVHGEKMGFNAGYKCRIRKRWYITPSLWTPDAYVLRQVGDYPKLIINKTDASSTDTIHRVRFKTNIQPEIIALSYLNSLTFAFSEILGRSYGGGVLTFEPSEIEEIPLPLLNHDNIDFVRIDALIRQRKIEEALDIVDEELLIKQLHFSELEVHMLRGIWKKLSDRRNRRNKS